MDHLLRFRSLLTACALLVMVGAAEAQSGVWNNAAGGDYDSSSNWNGNTVANGAGNTADFSQIDLNGDISINNVTSRTLGHLIFGDTNLATGGSVEFFRTGTTKITLSDPAPTITVNTLTPSVSGFDDVFFATYLGGTNGFTKLGDGILTLAGAADTGAFVGNDISGIVDIAEGTLRLDAGFSYYDFTNLVDPQAQSIDSFNIQDGATLDLGSTDLAAPQGVNTVTVPAGATATVRGANGAFINDLNGAGDEGAPSTLNVVVLDSNANAANTFSAHGNWDGFQTINISGTVGPEEVLDNFRIRPNGGNFNTTESFADSVVNLDNVRTFVRSNSTGNDVVIGELHGTATSEISGGSNPGGVARWVIGGNDTNSDHAGAITPSDGGLSLIKNGTGTLTLSGPLSYSPVNTADGGQAGNPDRRGGITTINAGTLALTGSSALPAGTDDTANLGLLWATVDIQADGTLDVSGATGTYSTAALQQVIGTGTIAGNYDHDEGRLAPGDDNVGNSATLARNAGTLNFANDLSFNGGEILYDVDETPAGNNDLIQVAGATTLGSGAVVTPNFLGAVPTSGTYTILSSTGGISGSTAGWSVAWPGRGGDLPVSISGNDLVFNAAATTGATIVWQGNISADWDVQATSNFLNGGSADQFFNGDDVTFNDTASQFNVNLAEDVQPLTMTVDSSTDYTFGGVGQIVGFASLTKRGTSTLTINTDNTYTGPTSIEAGTVDIVTNTGALGSGVLTMAGGTLRASNAVTSGMTNSQLNVAAGTSNTVISNGEPTNPATNQLILPNLAGSGDITVTTEVEGRLVDLGGVNEAFSGNLTIGPSGAATTIIARFSGDAASGIPNGTLTLQAGTTIAQRNNNAQTVQLGALSGDAGSTLAGFTGGGTAVPKGWEIGNLGTTTTFAGNIVNGGDDTATSVTKVGAGTLTLTGTNSYTGDTSVEGGTLSINSAYLDDLADVYLSTGAVFDLDFVGTDVIDSLFFDGLSQAVGTWGAVGSGATNTSSLFTGSGILEVTTFVEQELLLGDYNENGVVDAADYTLWRDNLGTNNVLANDAIGGTIGTAQYDQWKNNFGATAGAGSGAAVPEPSTLAALICFVLFSGTRGRRRTA